jgi:hypothetical protein
MFCKSCNYPLWNLAPGRCPECGAPFHPSDFDFVPNSVRFLCPHCNQDYYGTDPRGHLSPRAFDCVRCRRHISMDEMLLLPTEGVAEKQTQPEPMPWLDKSFGNPIRRWWGTLWRGVFLPARLLRATPDNSSSGAALGFALLSVIPAGLFGFTFIIWVILMLAGMQVHIAVAAICSTLLVPLLVLAWAALANAAIGMAGNRHHRFARTFHAFAYTSGIALPAAIPCVGAYLAVPLVIWWTVTLTLALAEVQRSESERSDGRSGPIGRSILAAAAPPAALAAALVAIWLVAILPAMKRSIATATRFAASSTGPNGRPYASLGAIRASTLLTALGDTQRRDGAFPATAALLVREPRVSPGDYFISNADPLAGDKLALGRLSFDQFKSATPDQAQAALAALGPPPPGPERIGEVVFTYQGIPPAASNKSLWLFITDAESANSSFGVQAATVRHIGQVDGSVRTIDAADLAKELAAENARRAAEGLPLLPDPDTVK